MGGAVMGGGRPGLPDAALHASVVVLGERGVLIRGASGAGKTALALALVERARASGGFARLVADDRALVTRHGEGRGGESGGGESGGGESGGGEDGARLVARPHPAIAGRAERRGLGIVAVEHEPACVVALVVDLVDGRGESRPDRMPEPGALRCVIAGVALPRLAVAAGPPSLDALALVASALSGAPVPGMPL